MEAIELVMKIWGIEESDRLELEHVLKTTPEKHLGLALMYLSASCDNQEFMKANDKWMATFLPELTLG